MANTNTSPSFSPSLNPNPSPSPSPIAKYAKENGYEELLPHLCRTDHVLAEVLHARLIRTQTEILGGPYCDYWYVGDRFVTGDGPNVI